MKTKCHSKKLRQTKRKQKKRKTTITRGGVHIIGHEDSPDIPRHPYAVIDPHIEIIETIDEDSVEDNPDYFHMLNF